jgi:phage protein U
VIGFYGDIVFETSDERILNFNGFTRNATSTWHNHRKIGGKPASEFIGPELDTISFTIHLSSNYGVNPQKEMDRWLEKCRFGTVDTLVIGNKALGVDKWKVLSVSQMWNVVLNRGELFSGDMEIGLEEYVEVLR